MKKQIDTVSRCEKITWEEKGDRVIGTIESGEEIANVDIPVELESWFVKDALEILSNFIYALRTSLSLKVGPFEFWLDDDAEWHFTSWDEACRR